MDWRGSRMTFSVGMLQAFFASIPMLLSTDSLGYFVSSRCDTYISELSKRYQWCCVPERFFFGRCKELPTVQLHRAAASVCVAVIEGASGISEVVPNVSEVAARCKPTFA